MHTKHTIPEGFCQCGCGGRTPISNYSDPNRGAVTGKPLPFLFKHRERLWKERRFWDRVDRDSTPDGCWEWRGNITSNGYGRYGQKTAHRMSYEIEHGSVPDGLMVCHRCGNRRCVRPDHLYAGTAKDNARDMIEHGTPTQCLTMNKNTKRGEGNFRSKLTEHDVREIRRMYSESDSTLAEIGERFGVTPTNIHSIVKRKTWTHI